MYKSNLFKKKFLKLLFFSFSISLFNSCSSDSIVYIDIKQVFSEFEMKKEREVEFKQIEKKRKLFADSLKSDLDQLYKMIVNLDKSKAKQKGIIDYKKNEQNYYETIKGLSEKNKTLMQKFDTEILSQLNNYIKEFGKENDYEIIIGSNGTGNLMYAKDEKNISEEVIIFVNKKYSGE